MERVKTIGRVVLTVVLVAGLGAGGWFGFHSEAFQRVLGKREGTKVVLDQARPEYVSAVVQERYLATAEGSPSTVSVADTFTIDRASNLANVERSSANTGLDAMQTSVGPATQPEVVGREIWTLDAHFTESSGGTTSWERRSTTEATHIGGVFHPYLVPVRNDVVGFELATLAHRAPTVPGVADPVAPANPAPASSVPADPATPAETLAEPAAPAVPATASGTVPHIDPSPPNGVTDLRRWTFDLATFKSLSPVAYWKTPFIELDRSTRADVTMGFDDAGVLRYLQVTVDPMNVPLVSGARIFSFEWSVLELSDAPVEIEVPTDVVDAPATTDATDAPASTDPTA